MATTRRGTKRSPGALKGALLEYLMRRLLMGCGFTPVVADNLYTFQNRGLFFVNGKGAAHDADVLMEPPFQIPFSYPTRIWFECKAYGNDVGLNTVRNLLGLRQDINEFEIVTQNTIRARQNNRSQALVENRIRHHYQVGLATINKFTQPAIEFATNNKIPILSLSSILSPGILNQFYDINFSFAQRLDEGYWNDLLEFLKDRSPTQNKHDTFLNRNFSILREDPIRAILEEFDRLLKHALVGIVESGDLIFLFSKRESAEGLFDSLLYENRNNRFKLYYEEEKPHSWSIDWNGNNQDRLRFFLPKQIMELWAKNIDDKVRTLEMKRQFFSRIIVFNPRRDENMPVSILRLNDEWISELIQYGNENN